MDETRRSESNRPDWHMRWPFALAYLAVVVVFFALDWRVGLVFLVWLPAAYASRKLLALSRRGLGG